MMKKPIFILVLLIVFISPLLTLFSSETKTINFSLPGLLDSSKTISLNDYKDKVVVLNIWASWCQGCREEQPDFVDIQEKYPKEKLVLITVNIDNNKDNALEFMDELKQQLGKEINFIALYDEKKELAKSLKPKALPVTYVINKGGSISKTIYGKKIDELKESIKALIAN